ncbi:alkaline phosphatase [Viridothelium virens]|uniref:Alkaline phosphatase n=1 Tax=Viridothelium virens TaxID=1048519 RepID=A0A6A6HEA7_VIRVR|nr:alkaline phosphatase [Viridothelium virens]
MSRNQEPLLSNRPSSEQSNDNDLAEEDALLTGERVQRPSGNDKIKWREWILFGWAFAATAVVIVLAVLYQNQKTTQSHSSSTPSGKRNLIFMVSDGMGPTSLSMTRSFRQQQYGLPYGDILVLDDHLIGQSRTRSSSSLVTDSAAGATAFSCGKKSYNGAISILPDFTPCGTVLEAAKKEGYMTGLVVTTRITDATPACFASHVNLRQEEDLIADQLIGNHPLGHTVDLILGGGRCRFLPNTTSASCREDSKDLVEEAKQKGYTYIDNRKDFDSLQTGNGLKLPFLGLFADEDIPYEIDRRFEDDTYPALREMAETALKALSAATKNSDKGFFLMIEGSRIDHAGHGNDPAAQVHEVLSYDHAFQSVLSFIEKEQTPSLLVGTSDHETGGLSAARQLHETYPEYLWYPEVLANASHSAHWLAHAYRDHLAASTSRGDGDKKKLKHYLRKLLKEHMGVHDASSTELSTLIAQPEIASYVFADIISRRAQIGWSTHGHSAADVNIYASDSVSAKPLVGNHENTEVGKFLRDWLDVDVDAVTKELRRKSR